MKNKPDIKDKRIMVQALAVGLAISAVVWELTGYLSGQQSPENA
jgi:hypothetical protein